MFLAQALRNQQAVKRIPMVERKLRHAKSMLELDGEQANLRLPEMLGNEHIQGAVERQFPDT